MITAPADAEALTAAEQAVQDGLRNASTRAETIRWTRVLEQLSRLRNQGKES
mgnify:CR=1 FL=1